MWVQSQVQRTLSEPATLERVRALLREAPEAHRTAIADRLCAELGFVDARGRAQRASCLKALRVLERRGQIALPAARTCPGPRQPCRLPHAVAPAEGVPDEAGALEGLEIVLVTDGAQRAIWNELMAREHPRGMGPPVGAQLRYLVGSAHGWLAALGFGGGSMHLAPRDHWIGWDAEQRQAQLHRVVCMNRFLIRPGVVCRNLASHVLGGVLRRLGTDFEARYGYRPWLVETFIEPQRHSGASLRATNWCSLGESCGRGRDDRAHAARETPKAIYVYALERDWRQRLGVGPAPPAQHGPLQPGEGLDAEHWAANEFGGAPLGDRRLTRRLVMSAQRQGEHPMRAFTGVARGDWAAVKGYYRLIDQPAHSEVSVPNILAPHRARTMRRMQAQPAVLCIQDGTDLSFPTRPQTEGLGVIGSNQTGAQSRGLHLHSTLAVSATGLPLGVLRAQFEAPPPKGDDVARSREEKKSFRWIAGFRDCVELAKELAKTQVISVCDREADLYDLFAEQHREPAVELIVRAKHNRRLAGEHGKLFETVRECQIRSEVSVNVERQSARQKSSKRKPRPGREQRTATLALRYREAKISSPADEPREPRTLTVWVVHAREHEPPPGEKAVEWFLLTTLTVESGAQAEEVLRWYCLRWRIEDWHRVLKSGCHIQELAHHTAERLERAIAINFVIAWRIMLMTLLGREVPELPAELLFSDLELKVLSAFARRTRRAPPIALGAAVKLVAMIGGYLDRKHDPPPGHKLVWEGYTTLAGMCIGYELRQEME